MALGKQPSAHWPGSNEIVSIPISQLRRDLFALVGNDRPESHLAEACLTTIDELWDEYGPPESELEPRHPAFDTGLPWPLQAGQAAIPAGIAPVGRRRGRKANAEANRIVTSILLRFAPRWKEHLSDICGALDEAKVALPKSNKWTSQECKQWREVLSTDKEGLVKALEYRFYLVSAHPTNDPYKFLKRPVGFVFL